MNSPLKYCRSLITNLFFLLPQVSVWTSSATVTITGWMFAPGTDYGLTKTAQDIAPSVKVGFLVFFLFKTDLVYGPVFQSYSAIDNLHKLYAD